MSGAELGARHRRWGWGSLALFAFVGLVLESLHGFKLGLYLDHETRRSMWRLAHAHGALLGLVHLALAAQLDRGAPESLEQPGGEEARTESRRRRAASRAFCIASACMPAGFMLGGLWFHGADPGVGIALVPLGGTALIYGCLRLVPWGNLGPRSTNMDA